MPLDQRNINDLYELGWKYFIESHELQGKGFWYMNPNDCPPQKLLIELPPYSDRIGGMDYGAITSRFATYKEVCTVLTIGHVYVPAIEVLCKRHGLRIEVLNNISLPDGVVLPENQSRVAVFCNIDEMSKLISVIVDLQEIHAALFRPDIEKVLERKFDREFKRSTGLDIFRATYRHSD